MNGQVLVTSKFSFPRLLKDGRTKNQVISFSNLSRQHNVAGWCHEFWAWLRLVLAEDHSMVPMIVHDELTCKKPRTRLIHQMKRIKVSTETHCKIFRFKAEHELKRLRRLFDETILCGAREKFPKLGLGSRALVGDEALNVIRASKDDDKDKDKAAFPLVLSKHLGGLIACTRRMASS
jgi:hypothetical protein